MFPFNKWKCHFNIPGRHCPFLIEENRSKSHIDSLDRYFAEIIDRCQTSKCQPALPSTDERVTTSTHPARETEQEDTLEDWLHCDTHVEDGIQCSGCKRWYHYACEELDESLSKFYCTEYPLIAVCPAGNLLLGLKVTCHCHILLWTYCHHQLMA